MCRPRSSWPTSPPGSDGSGTPPGTGRLSFGPVSNDTWLSARTFAGADFDPEALAAAKRATGTTVSVCLPALNVAETVGDIVTGIRDHWMDGLPLVDELVVIDSRSVDATAARAAEAGARVIQDTAILPECGAAHGKGEAMWKSLAATEGEVIAWIDADLTDFRPAYVPGLLGPLLSDPDIGFVKAIYRRLLGDTGDGGRVTEICARPLINLFYPELAGLAQPLAGEQAGRRDLLERVPFFTGYAVEIGLLIDLLEIGGRDVLAQVDLGERSHVNQSTAALGEMAFAIHHAVLQRLERDGRIPVGLADTDEYRRPERHNGDWSMTRRTLAPTERAPMCEVPGYRLSRVA
jgi:glucosyl-3-phosphoglycerate synthase